MNDKITGISRARIFLLAPTVSKLPSGKLAKCEPVRALHTVPLQRVIRKPGRESEPCVRLQKGYLRSIFRTQAKPFGFAGLSFTKQIFKIKKALLLQCFPDFGEPTSN